MGALPINPRATLTLCLSVRAYSLGGGELGMGTLPIDPRTTLTLMRAYSCVHAYVHVRTLTHFIRVMI